VPAKTVTQGGDFHISNTASSENMPNKKPTRSSQGSNRNGDFQISNGPVVRPDATPAGEAVSFPKLPRLYGTPVLVAIARDPTTIFAYWNVDWPAVFSADVPEDQQIHLRVLRRDGAEELTAAAEPMVAHIYITVSPTRGPYRIELGYYGSGSAWKPVAVSDEIVMPADAVSKSADVDLATIPFHLSFQRLVELFRLANTAALSTMIAQVQARLACGQDAGRLTDEEEQILREMNLSLGDLRSVRRGAVLVENVVAARRKRAEAILGLGASSPARPFGGSS
jgi:hypothetical protein